MPQPRVSNAEVIALISRYQAGDDWAFAELLDRMGPTISAVIRKSPSIQGMERADIVAELQLRLLVLVQRYDPERCQGQPYLHLYTGLVHRLAKLVAVPYLNRSRTWSNTHVASDIDPDDHQRVLDQGFVVQDHASLERQEAIDSLAEVISGDELFCLYRRVLDGWTYREIADALGRSSTRYVDNKILAAKQKLRAAVHDGTWDCLGGAIQVP